MYPRQRAKCKYAIAECNHKVQTNEKNEAYAEKTHTTRNRNILQREKLALFSPNSPDIPCSL